MSFATVFALYNDTAFRQRIQAALVDYTLNTVFAETTNDVQTVSVSGTPTGGSFTLANGPLGSAVAPAWNSTSGALQAAIQAALASGNTCVCTGGPLPGTSVVVTFTGNLANAPQNVMGVTANNLTGGSSPNAAVAHTTVGVSAVNHAARATLGAKILAEPSTYSVIFAMGVADDATVQADYAGGGNLSSAVTDAHIASRIAATFNNYV